MQSTFPCTSWDQEHPCPFLPISPLTPKLRFPFLFPEIFTFTAVIPLPLAASQTISLRCHLGISEWEQEGLMSAFLFLKKALMGRDLAIVSMACWLVMCLHSHGVLNIHSISAHSHLNWEIPFLLFCHLLFCKSKNLLTEKSYLLEREPTRRKMKGTW